MTDTMREKVYKVLSDFADQAVMGMNKAKPDGAYLEILNLITEAQIAAMKGLTNDFKNLYLTNNEGFVTGVTCEEEFGTDIDKFLNNRINQLQGKN